MTIFIKFLLIIAITFFLSACNESYTHEYLLQHPEIIRSELAKCRSATDYSDYCDRVKHTSDEFSALVNMRNENQEAFGKQILEVEISIATAKQNLDRAKKNYETLTIKNSSDSDMKTVRYMLNQAEQDYQAKVQKLKVLFAVVVEMSSSEL